MNQSMWEESPRGNVLESLQEWSTQAQRKDGVRCASRKKTKGWVIGGLIDNGTAVTTICRQPELFDERASAFLGTSELQRLIGTHHSCFQLAQPHKYLNSQDDIFNALQLLFCIYIYCNSTYPLVHLSLISLSLLQENSPSCCINFPLQAINVL